MVETLTAVELIGRRADSVVASVVDGQQTLVFSPAPFSIFYKKKKKIHCVNVTDQNCLLIS